MYRCKQGHFTDKEHNGKNCDYDNMSASELSKLLKIELSEEKEQIKFQEVMSGKGAVYLDKESYAKLCSAVRTKYGNKIPKVGNILIGNSYYKFKYSKRYEQILCVFELKIEGNEKLINELMR